MGKNVEFLLRLIVNIVHSFYQTKIILQIIQHCKQPAIHSLIIDPSKLNCGINCDIKVQSKISRS